MAKSGEATGLALLFVIESAAAALWCLAVGAALCDRRVSQKLSRDRDEEAEDVAQAVTAIVPARNEAGNIGDWIADVVAQTNRIVRIVVADDSSEDDTARIAQDWAQRDGRVEVLRCPPPPAGWIGKSWAAHAAGLKADTKWLLFSDADMRMSPTTVAQALDIARRFDAAAVSVTATLECETAPERIVMPAMAALIFTAYPICLIQDDRSERALLWGGFILVRRDAYLQVGGHASVRSEIAEDRALAQRLKAFGFRIRLINGSECVRVRMYAGLLPMWEGWRKNVYEGVHRNPVGALLFMATLCAMVVAPMPIALWIGLTATRRRLSAMERKLVIVAAAGCAGALGVRLLRDPFIGADLRSVVATPLAGLFISGVMAASAWRALSGAGQTWKGRTIH